MNTAVFYIFGLWGMIPAHVLTKSIVVASLIKVGVELIVLPLTLKVSFWLKKIENQFLCSLFGAPHIEAMEPGLPEARRTTG